MQTPGQPACRLTNLFRCMGYPPRAAPDTLHHKVCVPASVQRSADSRKHLRTRLANAHPTCWRRMVSAEDLQAALRDTLQAENVRVEQLEGCGPSFEVYVVSQQFEGKRLLERHKLINAAVAEFMPEIHALSIKKCWTPAQEAAAGS